ncbi:hypothetical protein [Flavobacterium gelatinilyticum]|uniref:hypothetical protein n=1 Tax=Flavobacterium gelatinilyticum TaxID=3003260 RepID=UPI0024811064|nr:hypothetical protein [Flavobacterium gelatinilyticum]
MDKRFFKVRYEVYKQIICIFLLFFGIKAISQNKNKIIVYEKKKKIGYLNHQTTESCNTCYYFITKKIFNKSIVIKLPATINGLKNELFFNPLYELKISSVNKDIKIIEFNSTLTGSAFLIYIFKNHNNLYLLKKLSYSNSSYQKSDNQGGVYNIPSSYICIQNSNQKIAIKDYLDFENLFDFNKIKECFHCPTNYTIDECIVIRNKKKKFNWK